MAAWFKRNCTEWWLSLVANDPFYGLPVVPTFTITSGDIGDGQQLAPPQMSGIFAANLRGLLFNLGKVSLCNSVAHERILAVGTPMRDPGRGMIGS
jgi:hypothetical protein